VVGRFRRPRLRKTRLENGIDNRISSVFHGSHLIFFPYIDESRDMR
jgi:hypothetical protein